MLLLPFYYPPLLIHYSFYFLRCCLHKLWLPIQRQKHSINLSLVSYTIFLFVFSVAKIGDIKGVKNSNLTETLGKTSLG